MSIEADSERVDKLLSELEGKSIEEVISAGVSKLASVPAGGGGGGGGAAAGGGGGAAGQFYRFSNSCVCMFVQYDDLNASILLAISWEYIMTAPARTHVTACSGLHYTLQAARSADVKTVMLWLSHVLLCEIVMQHTPGSLKLLQCLMSVTNNAVCAFRFASLHEVRI